MKKYFLRYFWDIMGEKIFWWGTMNQFQACLERARKAEATHWERTRSRVWRSFGRKIERNGGVMPAVCYQIRAYDTRGNPFRSTEVIDIDHRCESGWWERVGAGVVGHPAARQHYSSKWVIEDYASETQECAV